MKINVVLSAVLLLCRPAAAQTAQTARDIVTRADSVRNPEQPFRVTNAVVNYVGGKSSDHVVLTVYAKRHSPDGAFDNLVRYADPPRDRGKMVLFNGTNMWFYDPASKASVRISPQQRLIGLASNGDVATVSLARDYTASLTGTDTLQDADRVRRVAWHLDLVAADRDAIYSRIELWVEQGTYRPVKGKYYSDSGRLLKVAYFHKYARELGAERATETVIIDGVDPNLVTTMTQSDYAAQDIPDAWFQRDFLPQLSDASTVGEDRDLASIPGAVREAAAPVKTSSTRGRLYAEDAATASRDRSALAVPLPGRTPAEWENRSSVDAMGRWQLPDQLTLVLSGRLNVIEDHGVVSGFDLREGYVSWAPLHESYLEVGRINVHDGVALGFNPTDYFRSRTLIAQVSVDPSVRRDDRLGVLMVRAEHLWTGGEVSLTFAPRLQAPAPIPIGEDAGWSPEFDHTNGADRVLATAGADVAGLSPQVFFYLEGGRTQFGASVSRLVSQSVVGYIEYSGGAGRSLAEEATDFGKETGSLPGAAPVPDLGDAGLRFRSDVAAGASWANSGAKLTINAEIHYHETGFDRAAWRRWFAEGDSSSRGAAAMWYIRAFANDKQQPMARRQLFLRADRSDALIRDLELTGFAIVDLSDGSSLVQLAANYVVSDNWTLAAYVPLYLGGPHTEWGSLSQVAGVTVLVSWDL
ncbi:MAG TPA: outer membrane lipoprotein-sorting protein [Gemmatimonadales bacterium]|nr:outer membrane lipoprotein-sorting protein [Gemmatimonadales bacterium]